MIVLRVFVNLLILTAEIGAIIAIAWVGLHYPLPFAASTAGLALLTGLWLEHARLKHELPFYFRSGWTGSGLWVRLVSFLDALVKSILAGMMALLTFSGTDPERLSWVAIVFAIVLFAGVSLLRRLSISLAAQPSRWGYFRLAAPLGLLFSFALSFLPELSFADIGLTILLDLPERPTINQASEVLFILKQKFDALITALLSGYMPPDVARFASALLSVNILTGFVIALYAMTIASVVRWIETRIGV